MPNGRFRLWLDIEEDSPVGKAVSECFVRVGCPTGRAFLHTTQLVGLGGGFACGTKARESIGLVIEDVEDSVELSNGDQLDKSIRKVR